ncbi:MAG: YdcF family protein [Candidatus Rokubacteria bacterium]|nr:YdcF family protein [Candidatus Rokubacteria bacterium]
MKSRVLRVFIVLLAVGVLVAASLPALGLFLVVADPLQRSDAVFVLEGHTPARELEAAALYHGRWAPLIVLARARDPLPEITRRLAGEPRPHERALRVLRHRGVPAAAIVVLDRGSENTAQELGVDFAFARERGFRRVILVTSPSHTRRVSVIWSWRYADRIPAMVRPTSFETFAAERWWRSRHGLETAAHELFGMANFLLGSPLTTFDRE